MFKQKLGYALGSFGIVLSYLLSLIAATLPIIAIGGPWWLSAILIIASVAIPLPVEIPLWIWGLVNLIRTNPAAPFSIVYYVLMGVFVILYVIDFITRLKAN